MNVLGEDTQSVSMKMAESVLKAMETPIEEIGGVPSVLVINRYAALELLASSLDHIVKLCLQQKATS